MANQKLIYDIKKGRNTLGPELDKTKKKSKSLNDTIGAIGSSFLNIKGIVAGGIAVAGIGIAIEKSKQLENALIGLSSVARNTGNDVGVIQDAAKELAKDGLIPLEDAAASLKNLLSKGFSAEEALTVIKGLRDSASFGRQGQLALGEAVRGATEGIKNENSVMVDNAGVTKNLSVINKEYAAQIGKTVNQLSAAEKRQAFLTVGLKETAVNQGDYNKLLETFSGASAKASTGFSFLLASIGDAITRTPEAKEFLTVLANGFTEFKKIIDGTDTAKLGKVIDFLLVTPAKFWIDFLTDGESSAKGVKEINKELDVLNTKLGFATKKLEQTSEGGKGLKAGFLQGLLGGFKQAQKDVGLLNAEISELTTARNKLFAEGGAEFVGPLQPGARKEVPEEVNQAALDAERKKQEELLAIAQEFAILKEEQRIAEREFASEAEQAEFDALKLKVGERNAEKLLAQKNLAKGEIAERKNELATQKAFLDQKFKLEKDLEKKTQQLEKDKIANRRSTFATIATLSQSNNSTLAAIGKAAGITQIAIDTPVAISKALAAFPPPFNFAAAGLVGTAMAAQAARIAGVGSFQEGGILSSSTSSGDQNIFRGNNGEVILNKPMQNELLNIARGNDQPRGNQGPQTIEVKLELEGNVLARVIRTLQTDGFLA